MYDRFVQRFALRCYLQLRSFRKVANMLGSVVGLTISHTTINRWWTRLPCPPLARSRQPRKAKPFVLDAIKAFVHCHPCCTMAEVADAVQSACGITISKELARTTVRKLGLTRKRAKHYHVPATQAVQVDAFKAQVRSLPPDTLIASIDEINFDERLAPTHGWCTKGQRLYIERSAYGGFLRGRRRTTVVACATSDGAVLWRAQPGTMNTPSFLAFAQSLNLPAGTAVLLDNVAFHKSNTIRAAFSEKGLTPIFTPPYAPWFNPIEYVFAQVKHTFRKQRLADKSVLDAMAVSTATIQSAFQHVLSHLDSPTPVRRIVQHGL